MHVVLIVQSHSTCMFYVVVQCHGALRILSGPVPSGWAGSALGCLQGAWGRGRRWGRGYKDCRWPPGEVHVLLQRLPPQPDGGTLASLCGNPEWPWGQIQELHTVSPWCKLGANSNWGCPLMSQHCITIILEWVFLWGSLLARSLPLSTPPPSTSRLQPLPPHHIHTPLPPRHPLSTPSPSASTSFPHPSLHILSAPPPSTSLVLNIPVLSLCYSELSLIWTATPVFRTLWVVPRVAKLDIIHCILVEKAFLKTCCHHFRFSWSPWLSWQQFSGRLWSMWLRNPGGILKPFTLNLWGEWSVWATLKMISKCMDFSLYISVEPLGRWYRESMSIKYLFFSIHAIISFTVINCWYFSLQGLLSLFSVMLLCVCCFSAQDSSVDPYRCPYNHPCEPGQVFASLGAGYSLPQPLRDWHRGRRNL